MGWRFRKSVKIFPGVRLNFGKKGITSATIGRKYAKTNISSKGTHNTYSLPGTGISYRTKTTRWQSNRSASLVTLDRYCQNCSQMNAPDSQFCSSCGGICPPNPQSLARTSNDAKIILGVVGGVFGFFMLCGFLSLIGSNSRQIQTVVSEPQKSSFESNSGAPLTPSPQHTPKTDVKADTPLKNIRNKPAEVISENANLRKTSDQTGEVIIELPQGTTVKVLKQKGAWFLVQAAAEQGWLHGNTIKLIEDNQVNETSSTYSNSSSVYLNPSSSSGYSSSSSGGYFTGPRGGCYTYSSSGKKRYVDRSYCR